MQDVWRAFKLALAYGLTQCAFIVIGYSVTGATGDEGWLFVTAVVCMSFHYSSGKAVEWAAKLNIKREIKDEYKYSNRPEKEIPIMEEEPEIKPRASSEMNDD